MGSVLLDCFFTSWFVIIEWSLSVILSMANVHLRTHPDNNTFLAALCLAALCALCLMNRIPKHEVHAVSYMFLHDIFASFLCSTSSKIRLLFGTEDCWFGLISLVC